MGLLVSTAACVVLVNLIVVQLILVQFYPTANARLGTAGLVALGVVAGICILYAVRGWRAYLAGPPRE